MFSLKIENSNKTQKCDSKILKALRDIDEHKFNYQSLIDVSKRLQSLRKRFFAIGKIALIEERILFIFFCRLLWLNRGSFKVMVHHFREIGGCLDGH